MRLIALLSLIALTSCHVAPKSTNLAPISFAASQPIRVAVADIQVIDEYRSPMHKPNVEQDFFIPPAQGVRSWVNERLRATGGTGRLEIVIHDASVREVPLPVKQGLKGMFYDEQNARYEGNLKVTMRLYDGTSAMSKAQGDVSVSRTHTINEKATINQRERLWHDMTRDMMVAFDKEAELRMRQYFANYLR